MIFNIALTQNALPDGRLFALDQQTLISIAIQLFNFCLLALILGLLLYKPVQKFMRARAERIGGQIEEASRKMLRAEELGAEYEAKLNEIDAERIAVLEAARLEAAERSKHMLEEARVEAASIKHRAEERILAEREQFQRESWRHMVEISSLMAEKLVGRTMDHETHAELFQQALAELEDTPWPG